MRVSANHEFSEYAKALGPNALRKSVFMVNSRIPLKSLPSIAAAGAGLIEFIVHVHDDIVQVAFAMTKDELSENSFNAFKAVAL
jgi:hypothetical protein